MSIDEPLLKSERDQLFLLVFRRLNTILSREGHMPYVSNHEHNVLLVSVRLRPSGGQGQFCSELSRYAPYSLGTLLVPAELGENPMHPRGPSLPEEYQT